MMLAEAPADVGRRPTGARRSGRSPWRARVAVVVVALVALAAGIRLTATGGAEVPSRVSSTDSLSVEEFEHVTGIRIVRVAYSAGGGLLDLAYQILEPNKSGVLHNDDLPPGLYNDRTREVLLQPFHDHSHDGDLHQAIVYHELLVNSGGAVEPGDDVSVLVGRWRLDGVDVQ